MATVKKQTIGTLACALDADQLAHLAQAVEAFAKTVPHTIDTAAVMNALRHHTRLIIDHNAKTRVGCAKYRQGKIELHQGLFKRGNEQFKLETLWHEIAHFITYYADCCDGHGPYWRAAMRCLGQTPERCASNEKVVAIGAMHEETSKYKIYCDKCNAANYRHRINATRKREYQTGARFHGGCGGTLRLKIRS